MLYEKKKSRPKEFVPLLCVEIALLAFLAWEIIYYYTDIPKTFWDMKFVDVANVIAQFATACAFGLGFHQYHRGKRLDRQLALVSECKAVVLKMVVAIKEFDVGPETNIKNIKSCCITLGGLGSDFNELFVSLDESVHKGIVRMHWQDMFFNELLKAVSQLELSGITTNSNIKQEDYLFALAKAKVNIKHNAVAGFLESYFTFLYVLQSDRMKAIRESFEFADVCQFVFYFFDKKYTDDYMYGSLSQLDIRARAPLIAAINFSCR